MHAVRLAEYRTLVMKNRDKWKPSKYVYKKGKLTGSRNVEEVAIGSRLIADITAAYYDANIKKYVSGILLDVGCGKVPLFGAYKEYVTDNICIDWEASLHENEYTDLECDLTKNLPLGDEEFDTIILSDVLEHIPEPRRLCDEIYRVLSRNGRIIMNVPFYYWLHEQPHDYYRYTEFALRRFVESSGFKVVLLEPTGGAPEIMADILAKNILCVPIIGRLIAAMVQYTTSVFIKTRIGKKISKRTGKKFPLGYFLVAEKET